LPNCGFPRPRLHRARIWLLKSTPWSGPVNIARCHHTPRPGLPPPPPKPERGKRHASESSTAGPETDGVFAVRRRFRRRFVSRTSEESNPLLRLSAVSDLSVKRIVRCNFGLRLQALPALLRRCCARAILASVCGWIPGCGIGAGSAGGANLSHNVRFTLNARLRGTPPERNVPAGRSAATVHVLRAISSLSVFEVFLRF